MKRRQLNTPRWRSKPLLSFCLLHSLFSSSHSFSGAFRSLFPLPHSLFEEVRFSLSLLFFSYRCRRAASALNIIVGGSCAAAVRLWEVLRSRQTWWTANPANQRAGCPFTLPPTFLLLEHLCFFPQELQVMTITLNPHRLSLGILLQNGVHNKLTNLIHSLICMIGSLWTFFTSWSSVNLLYILRHIQILCFE